MNKGLQIMLCINAGIIIGMLIAIFSPAFNHAQIIEQNNTVVTERLVIANVTSTLIKECAPCSCDCTCIDNPQQGPSGGSYSVYGAWANNGTGWWK